MSVYQCKRNTISAVAKHLRLNKTVLENSVREGNEETYLLRLPEIKELSQYEFYCSPKTYKVLDLLNFDKFYKSDIWDEWRTGNGYILAQNFMKLIMTFKLKSTLMVFYRADGYDGLGGWFGRHEGIQLGTVVEPMSTWLTGIVSPPCVD